MRDHRLASVLLIWVVTAGVGCGTSKDAVVPTCAAGSVACACSNAYSGVWATGTDAQGRLDPSTDTLLNDAPWVNDGGTWESCTQNTPASMLGQCVTIASSTQHHMLGTTPDGSTLLVHRGPIGGCGISGGAGTIWIYDGTLSPYSYSGQDITATLAGLGLDLTEGQLTLDPDGLGVVGRLADGSFVETRRSATGKADFGATSAAAFATLDALSGARSGPAFSADGSLFFFALGSSWQQARRSPAGVYGTVTVMDAIINDGAHVVTGATADGLNVFAWDGFATFVFYRSAIDQPLKQIGGPFAAWWARPVDGCQKLVATESPGGCQNERIELLTAK